MSEEEEVTCMSEEEEVTFMSEEEEVTCIPCRGSDLHVNEGKYCMYRGSDYML